MVDVRGRLALAVDGCPLRVGSKPERSDALVHQCLIAPKGQLGQLPVFFFVVSDVKSCGSDRAQMWQMLRFLCLCTLYTIFGSSLTN